MKETVSIDMIINLKKINAVKISFNFIKRINAKPILTNFEYKNKSE